MALQIHNGLNQEAERAHRVLAPLEKRVELSDLLVRTKTKRLVPFKPNAVQVQYLDLLAPDWRSGSIDLARLREIILKARQFGFSTLIAALFFCDTVNTPNTTTVVVANDSEGTEKLFRMVQLFYEHLPPEKKPVSKYASKREFYWPEINSSYYVGTAGDRSFGRGTTINNLHLSEVAFYPDAETLMTGLLEAVPEDGTVFQESTANGVGDYFNNEFMLAYEGNSSYVGRFFAWFEHPEYSKEPPPDFERTSDEAALAVAYGLTDGQLNWRRQKMKGPGMRKKFPQEYPSNPAEAFMVTGQKYFDVDALQKLALDLASVVTLATPAPDRKKFPLLNKYWKELEVYTLPVSGHQYVVSADTAEGLDASGRADFDSADVLDCETWEQVAHLHGSWQTHEYGLLLAELGEFYNWALLGIERNNHGHAVINAATHVADYPDMRPGKWSGLYYHEEYDEEKKVAQRKPGWPTTAKSKYFALDNLANNLVEQGIKVKSKATHRELTIFLHLPGGKAGAQTGAHDDRVMSLAIGNALLQMRPPQTTASTLTPAMRMAGLKRN